MASHPVLTHATELFSAGRNTEALVALNRLAAQGDPEGLFMLGDMYWRGVHVTADPARGRELFRRASNAGHPMARRAFTNLLASGIGGPRDWPAALARLRDEARDDQRRALMLALLGKMDLTDAGDPRSLPQPRRILESPDLVGIPGLFTREECEFLILVAEPTYGQSMVVDEQVGDYRNDAIRTSDDAPMHWLIEDPAIHALNRRIAAVSGTSCEQGEPLLILRYRPGQEYKRHLDALPGLANQRVKTLLVYLNEDYAGGETAFVQAGQKVRGTTGDAVLFVNVGPDGRADPMSEHAGLPVESGTKYLASRWIRGGRHLPVW